jgi:hypothetical protein
MAGACSGRTSAACSISHPVGAFGPSGERLDLTGLETEFRRSHTVNDDADAVYAAAQNGHEAMVRMLHSFDADD